MKFLVTNMGGFRNKGCEASVKAIVNEIVKLDNEAYFKIFTRTPEYGSLWFTGKRNVSFLLDPFMRWHFFSRWWQYLLVGRLATSPIIKPAVFSTIKNGVDAFRWADTVISTGGDVFSSTYGSLNRHLATIQVAGTFKKSVCLIGQSIGPFERESEYKAFIKAMKNVQLITARESLSFKYLMKMKLQNIRVELTADPAFCLEPNMEKIHEILKAYNILDEKPIAGIAPSQLITYYTKPSYIVHFKVLQKLAEFLMEDLGYHVVLIPHVRGVSVKGDDRIVCEKLYRNLNFPKGMTVLSLDHSAEEIRALMSKLDLLIAERMHAAIAGLAQHVPTFVIGYSVKAQGILGDIFGFENLEDYMILVKKLNEETLKEHVKGLLTKRDEVSKHLSKVIPRIKNYARRNFRLVMDVLKSGNVED